MTVNVIVSGSVNVDERIEVPHIPYPGETVISPGTRRRDLGGKGANQAMAAARLGAEVTLVCAIGEDDNGQWAHDRLSAELHSLSVKRFPLATGRATILVDASGENSIVVEPGANAELQFTPPHRDLLRGKGVLVLQLETPIRVAADFAVAARQEGRTVITNTAPAPTEWSFELQRLLEATDLLILNEVEREQLLRVCAGHESQPLQSGLRKLGVPVVVVTLGSDGIEVITSDGEFRVAAHPAQVVDTTGAGDACTAGIAVGIAECLDLRAAVELGNVCGSIAVEAMGTTWSFPSRHQAGHRLVTAASLPGSDRVE